MLYMNDNNPNLIEKILNQLDRIENQLKTIENTKESPSLDDWITELDAQELLNVKHTSLWRLRQKGAIEYTKVGNKTYYSHKSILEFLDVNKKATF